MGKRAMGEGKGEGDDPHQLQVYFLFYFILFSAAWRGKKKTPSFLISYLPRVLRWDDEVWQGVRPQCPLPSHANATDSVLKFRTGPSAERQEIFGCQSPNTPVLLILRPYYLRYGVSWVCFTPPNTGSGYGPTIQDRSSFYLPILTFLVQVPSAWCGQIALAVARRLV